MTVKLVDIFQTRYFYKTIGVDIKYMLDSCKHIREDPTYQPNVGSDLLGEIYEAFRSGESVTFDLAGAVLTTDVAMYIPNYQRDGFDFIDSENAWRNEILKTNSERLNADISDAEPLPEFTAETQLKPYLAGLRANAKYVVTGDYKVTFPLVTIISIIKPSISFIFPQDDAKYLEFVYRQLNIDDLKQFHEFYMVTAEGIQVVRDDAPIYVQHESAYIDINDLMDSIILVPTDFGKVVLYNNGIFKNICNNCIKTLQKFQESAAKPLEEVLLHGY